MIEAQIAPQERTRPAKEFQKPRLLPGSARIQTGKPRAEERVTGQTLGAYVRAGLVWSRKSEAPVWVAIWVCGAIVLVVSFVFMIGPVMQWLLAGIVGLLQPEYFHGLQ